LSAIGCGFKPGPRLADLKGRVVNVDDPMATILKETCDMRITFFDPADIYTAMATGTLDGTEYGSIVAMTSIGLEEVGHYLMQPDYQIFWCGCYCISDNTYNTMPADLRAILMQGIKAHTLDMRTTYMDMTGEALQKFFAAGGQLVVLPNEDIELLSKKGLEKMQEMKETDDYCRRAVQIIEESLVKLGRG
jgi:TRAP-type C4-dicarboxylate transport system substrate-binding protein